MSLRSVTVQPSRVCQAVGEPRPRPQQGVLAHRSPWRSSTQPGLVASMLVVPGELVVGEDVAVAVHDEVQVGEAPHQVAALTPVVQHRGAGRQVVERRQTSPGTSGPAARPPCAGRAPRGPPGTRPPPASTDDSLQRATRGGRSRSASWMAAAANGTSIMAATHHGAVRVQRPSRRPASAGAARSTADDDALAGAAGCSTTPTRISRAIAVAVGEVRRLPLREVLASRVHLEHGGEQRRPDGGQRRPRRPRARGWRPAAATAGGSPPGRGRGRPGPRGR